MGFHSFLDTDMFRLYCLLPFIPTSSLETMRMLSKDYYRTVNEYYQSRIAMAAMIVHEGSDVNHMQDRLQRDDVTQVVFLLNITKVGIYACYKASILVVVDIPEGVESIGNYSFMQCSSLKEISFPKSLTSIGRSSFISCSGLEKVDLLHTNLQKLGDGAFFNCTSLRAMKIPDSLQTLGDNVFYNCSKLVPSNIDFSGRYAASEVVAYLRSIQ